MVCWGNNGNGKSTLPAMNIVTDNDGDGVDDAVDAAKYDASIQ
jgi:hypothetical protein